jgi:hypothetical protein
MMSKDQFTRDQELAFEEYANGEMTRAEAVKYFLANGWRVDDLGAELNQIDDEEGRAPREPADIPGETT